MARIFISYRTSTSTRLAEHLVESLESLGYQRPFLDRSIPVGADWQREIRFHLAHCPALVVLWDEEAKNSSYVEYELQVAQARIADGEQLAMVFVMLPGLPSGEGSPAAPPVPPSPFDQTQALRLETRDATVVAGRVAAVLSERGVGPGS